MTKFIKLNLILALSVSSFIFGSDIEKKVKTEKTQKKETLAQAVKAANNLCFEKMLLKKDDIKNYKTAKNIIFEKLKFIFFDSQCLFAYAGSNESQKQEYLFNELNSALDEDDSYKEILQKSADKVKDKLKQYKSYAAGLILTGTNGFKNLKENLESLDDKI